MPQPPLRTGHVHPIIAVLDDEESIRRALGGLGKIVHLGKLPLNCQLGAYWNVRTPTNGPDWQLRAQIQFMFPK